MNKSNAKEIINNLSPGLYAGHDWISPSRAHVYFTTGIARDTVADYGLSGVYNSGKPLEDTVTVTDRYTLKALRKAHPPHYKVRMQTTSGHIICADREGYPSDWVMESNPEPEAALKTRDAAAALVALVVRRGYARPWIVLR
jgi:hypothetical protein